MSLRGSMFNGWKLIGWTALVLAVGMSLLVSMAASDVEAARATIRFTARVSVILFLSAFTASALWHFWPGSFTRWQRSNRRYFGLSFALSHFVHLGAIITLGFVAPDQLMALTTPVSWIGGGLAYALLTVMAITSFDRTAALLKPKTWTLIHTIGSYYFSLVFANSFVTRAVKVPEYILPAVLVLTAIGLRIAFALLRSRSQNMAGRTPLAARGD